MYRLYRTRNLPNGYVMTAGGVQERELNQQTKHCSAKHEKEVKINNSLQHWAGCMMVDVCMISFITL